MKTRASFVVIISLLLGVAIGFITANQIHHSRFKEVKSLSSSDSFKERTYNIIHPSETQIDKLDPIVDKYGQVFDSLRKHTYCQFRDLFEEYHQTMTPFLSEDQIKAVKESSKHFKREHKKKEED